MVEKKLRLLKGNTYNSTEKDAYANGMRAASRTQNRRAEKGRSNFVIDETAVPDAVAPSSGQAMASGAAGALDGSSSTGSDGEAACGCQSILALSVQRLAHHEA